MLRPSGICCHMLIRIHVVCGITYNVLELPDRAYGRLPKQAVGYALGDERERAGAPADLPAVPVGAALRRRRGPEPARARSATECGIF